MASNLCIAIFSGRAVADAEVRQSGAVAVSIAVNKTTRNPETQEFEDSASFFDLVGFGNTGRLMKKIQRGDSLTCHATPNQAKWQDKTTGDNRSRVVFYVERIEGEFMWRPQDAPDEQPEPQQAPKARARKK